MSLVRDVDELWSISWTIFTGYFDQIYIVATSWVKMIKAHCSKRSNLLPYIHTQSLYQFLRWSLYDFPCSQKLCAEFHRSNESNPHQILFPVTWQDEGPATLGSVKLTRVDADASRATAMISAAAAAATQAVKLILQGWHVTNLWYFLNRLSSSNACATLHIRPWDYLYRFLYISLYLSA